MLGWLVMIAVLLCSSCVGQDAADKPGPEGPPATETGIRESVPIEVLDDDPCRRACGLAAMAGCVSVSAQCADGGWPLFAVVGGLGILCSRAMEAACGGSTGLNACQAACPK